MTVPGTRGGIRASGKEDRSGQPATILWIAVPLFLQTCLIFLRGYVLSMRIGPTDEDAAPSAMIGASNHFEVAIATATILFGLASGAALATMVEVIIEVPVMLMRVKVCLRTRGWFGGWNPLPAPPRSVPRRMTTFFPSPVQPGTVMP